MATFLLSVRGAFSSTQKPVALRPVAGDVQIVNAAY